MPPRRKFESPDLVRYRDLPPLEASLSKVMSVEKRIMFNMSILYTLYIFSILVLNFFMPGLMNIRIWGGITLTWFLTAILGMLVAMIFAALHFMIIHRASGHCANNKEAIYK